MTGPEPTVGWYVDAENGDDDDDDPFFIEVIRRGDFSFDGRNDTGSTVELAVGIDTSDWRSGVMEVLLHDKNTWETDSKLAVSVTAVSVVPESPAVTFVGSSLCAVRLVDTDQAPLLLVAPLTSVGDSVRVVLEWFQPSTEAAEPQRATLSIRLVGRPH